MNLWDVEEFFSKRKRVSSKQVQAGIGHPSHFVVMFLGTHHKLTPEQLVTIKGRDDIPQWVKEEIIASQEKRSRA